MQTFTMEVTSVRHSRLQCLQNSKNVIATCFHVLNELSCFMAGEGEARLVFVCHAIMGVIRHEPKDLRAHRTESYCSRQTSCLGTLFLYAGRISPPGSAERQNNLEKEIA